MNFNEYRTIIATLMSSIAWVSHNCFNWIAFNTFFFARFPRIVCDLEPVAWSWLSLPLSDSVIEWIKVNFEREKKIISIDTRRHLSQFFSTTYFQSQRLNDGNERKCTCHLFNWKNEMNNILLFRLIFLRRLFHSQFN